MPSTHLGVEPDVSPVEQWRGHPILLANRALEPKAGREEAIRRLRLRVKPSLRLGCFWEEALGCLARPW